MKASPLQPSQRPAPTVHGFKISNLKLKYVFRTFSLMIYKCTKLWVTTKISSFAFVFITYIYKACQVFNGSLKAMPERNLCLQARVSGPGVPIKKKKKTVHMASWCHCPAQMQRRLVFWSWLLKTVMYTYITHIHAKSRKKNRSRI